MKKTGNVVLTILFLTYIFGLGIFTYLTPTKDVSYYENRTLAQEPVKDLRLIASGEYFRQYEEYFADQFVARDHWVNAFRQSQVVSSQISSIVQGVDVQVVDGFHITNDGWIMAAPITYFPQEGIEEAARQMEALAAKLDAEGTEFYYAILPNKLSAVQLDLPSDRPEGRTLLNKQYMLSNLENSNVSIIDVSQTLSDTYDQTEINDMFFKTDHHWNMDGAFTGYKYLINSLRERSQLNFDPVKDEDYLKTCIEDITFVGSWNRQLGGIVQADELVCYYNPIVEEKQFHNLEVYNGPIKKENETTWNHLYANLENAKGNTTHYGDAYASDYRELNIINSREEDKPNILVLKDSFTNPISFHIASHFHRTTIYDMRHNEDRSLNDFLAENEYDIVVVLYNENVLSGEMFHFQ